MRVCHICSNYDRFFTNLMETQIADGTELRVFYFRARERGLPDVKAPYVDVRLNYSNWHRPFFYLKESTIIKDFFGLYKDGQFDMAHAHTLFSNGYVALEAKKRWGLPYIVAVRNVDINTFFRYRVNLRKLGIEILDNAEKIVFLSKTYQDMLFSKYIPEEKKAAFLEKSVVIPNGIDPFYLENRAEFTQRADRDAVHIITAGHVCRNKNQLTVCKAVERLISSGIKADYTIIGKVLDDKVFRKVMKYPFVKYIPFLEKDKLIEEYRDADVFVMPSYTETFGLTYVEAMSQGKPVVYSKGQGFDGQFEEGIVGYRAHSGDDSEIAERIMEIMSNYDQLSRNCIELCGKYNWNDIALKYEGIYESAAK